MDLDRTQLAEAEDIVIDRKQSLQARMRSFIEQTGNPYAFKVGAYIVQVGFQEDTEEYIEDRILVWMKRGGYQ